MSVKISALKVRQWLPEWNKVEFGQENWRREPPKFFLSMAISARLLRKMSGIYRRRDTSFGELSDSRDTGIQRQLNPSRSTEISKYLKYGYPCSQMSQRDLDSPKFERNLLKPGWLPTSVVLNVLTSGDSRNGIRILDQNLARFEDSSEVGALCHLILPDEDQLDETSLYPFEIIDGQHRLMAIDDSVPDDFELPVVAFIGLDISWQAYLFWTINIKPKKNSPSLAFDLYPLLRTQQWLEMFNGPIVYREARAQELVEILFEDASSPWRERINMLGERGPKFRGQVTQAAWIKSLLASYVKTWNSPDDSVGGFFGQAVRSSLIPVPWSRLQQAAFLIFLGNLLKKGVDSRAGDLRLGFEDAHSLLNTDQGVRGFLVVTNLVFSAMYSDIASSCAKWRAVSSEDEQDVDAGKYSSMLMSTDLDFASLAREVVKILSEFDWRSYDATFKDDESVQKEHKAIYRGAGGYRHIREDLLRFLRDRTENSRLREVISGLMA